MQATCTEKSEKPKNLKLVVDFCLLLTATVLSVSVNYRRRKINMDVQKSENNPGDVEAMEDLPEDSKKKTKAKKLRIRSTDHRVLRIETDEAGVNDDNGEFMEKKKRGKRLKRKAPGPATTSTEGTTTASAEAMDTDVSAPKKPHFPKLNAKQEMVCVCAYFVK